MVRFCQQGCLCPIPHEGRGGFWHFQVRGKERQMKVEGKHPARCKYPPKQAEPYVEFRDAKTDSNAGLRGHQATQLGL